jgi:hypothetical protein
VESYQVEAFYYILKPIKEDVLFGQLTKAIQSIVVEHTIHLYLRDGELIKNFGTMSQLEYTLCRDARFIKPHRSISTILSSHSIKCNDSFCVPYDQ